MTLEKLCIQQQKQINTLIKAVKKHSEIIKSNRNRILYLEELHFGKYTDMDNDLPF